GRSHLGPEPLLLPEQTKVTPLLFSVLRAILTDARKSQTLGPALLRIRADSTPPLRRSTPFPNISKARA
ncbi:MAG TPA: hypothetical protein VGX93_06385, partial [Chthoniobacterales bacterium]|nr:hypothetical protein [Chthoniobacterales bacterium]